MKLREVIEVLDAAFPPSAAESWDSVGLICGDPQDEVRSVLFAMDPLPPVVDEALELGVDLLVTHHPLFLRGTSSVAATTSKGRSVHRLIRGGCALLNAHTNHDASPHGTNHVLAELLGLQDVRALQPATASTLDTLVTFVPTEHAQRLLDALTEAGAGRLGDYERAAYLSEGTGTFRPLEGAEPAVGQVGATEQVPETRIEISLPRRRREDVLAALRRAHPYEEPAFTLVEHAATAVTREVDGAEHPVGMGRVGELPQQMTLAEFTDLVASVLPETTPGVLAGGPPDAPVRTVALCSGAGDSMLGDARAAGADVYLTGDLRHHPATDHLAEGGPYLVDATHFATESVAMERMARVLDQGVRERGGSVQVHVSTRVTDPWTYRATRASETATTPGTATATGPSTTTDSSHAPATEGHHS